MFLSATEIAQSREHALRNFLGLSSASIEASQRLATLFSATGRQALEYNSQLLPNLDSSQIGSASALHAFAWVEILDRMRRMTEEALEIVGEAHKAMIRSAEAQVCVFDEIAFASIRRASKTSPWEAEQVLIAMKATLQSAEVALHEISTAAVESVEVLEQESARSIENLPSTKPARRKRQSAPK